MKLVDTEVIHPTWGEGIIAVHEEKSGFEYITVEFREQAKRFCYPEAFESILHATDPYIQDTITRDISARKEENEKENNKKAMMIAKPHNDYSDTHDALNKQLEEALNIPYDPALYIEGQSFHSEQIGHEYRDLCYIYTYYPKNKFRCLNDEISQQREQILAYKSGASQSVLQSYTRKMAETILEICSILSWKTVWLVAVPTSDPTRKTTIASSISIITRRNEINIHGITLVNRSGLLIRTEPISTAHTSEVRPSKADHMRTIEITGKSIPADIKIILIDDIYTSGTQMRACIDTLVDHGADMRNIQPLVLARTIDLLP